MKKYKIKPKKKLSFKEAVEATKDVKACYKVGKRALLNQERNKVELTETSKCGGSLFIDQCLIDQNKYPNANRWDYAIDYNGETYFFEIHTANSGEVSSVVRKLEWLKEWLRTSAPELNKLRAKQPFFWIQSDGYHIPKNSAFERIANQNGILPIKRLILK